MTVEPRLIACLIPIGYDAQPRQALLFTFTAWDTDCPQHIPRKVNLADAAAMLASRDARIEKLEAELLLLRGRQIPAASFSSGEHA